jgi:hypothetical protein
MNITSILLSSVGTVFAVGLYVMNALIAFGVYLDAQKQTVSAHRDLKLFSPGTWGLICLFGSVPALAVYWAAHHSTLAK